MSEQTKAALAEAIAAHVEDEAPGSIVGTWLVLTETTNLEDMDRDQSSMYVDSHGSTFTQRGLVEAWRDRDRSSTNEGDE